MITERIDTIAIRISKALKIRNIKQSYLCKLTGIPKSALSQYINGAFEPKQDRIYLISKALNVSEAWLMGYDVPMEREQRNSPTEIKDLSEGELLLLELFRKVPENQQDLVLQMIRVALKTKE